MTSTLGIGFILLALFSLIGAFVHLMRSTEETTPKNRTSTYALISMVLSSLAIGAAIMSYVTQFTQN